MPTPRTVRGCIAIGALSLAGCSHDATLRLKNGNDVYGEIVGGTHSTVVVRTSEATPEPTRVRREDIEHIYHPGTAATIVGGLFTVAGLAVMAYGIGAVDACGGGDFCAFGHLFFTVPGAGVAALSLGPTIWGIYAWTSSASAASPPDGVPPPKWGANPSPPSPGVFVRF